MLKGEFKIKKFLQGLTNLSSAVKNDPSLPILSCVLLESREEGLRLAATNLEAGINFFVQGKLEGKGSLCVPFKSFLNYISSLEGETLSLQEEDRDKLEVKSESSKAVFRIQSGADFPFQFELIDKLKEKLLGKTESRDLKEGIFKVAFAASKDEARPELCGILFQFNADKLVMVGTDSYRLAEAKIKLKTQSSKEAKLIIPAYIAKALAYILVDEGEVNIFLSENQVLFELNSLIFTSRLTEGNYPDYKEVIPQNLETEALISKDRLAQAVKRVGFFTDPQSPAIKIIVLPSKSQIKIKAQSSLVGSSYALVECKAKGLSREVSYNYSYLLEGLGAIAEDRIVFKTSGPERPGLFLGEQNSTYLYVVMPIRTD